MSRLLLALLGTTIVTVWIGAALRNSLLPYEWGCDDCIAKIDHLRGHRDTYDTFVFGDSRVLGHIDPEMLDQEIQKIYPISSFNFGIASLNPFETLYLYEHLLRDEGLRPRFALFQVNTTPIPSKVPYNTSRRYWMTLPFTLKAMLASRETSANAMDTLSNWRNYSAGFLLRLLGIHAIDGWRTSSQNAQSRALLGRGGRGFRILDDQMSQVWLQERSSEFRRDTRQYDYMVAVDRSLKDAHCDRAFDAHLYVYDRLMRLSEEHGIYPIFFLPFPNWNQVSLCIYSRLPPEHRLSIVRMADDPQAFTQDQFIYSNHLNYQAARVYTRLFAKTFADLLLLTRPSPSRIPSSSMDASPAPARASSREARRPART